MMMMMLIMMTFSHAKIDKPFNFLIRQTTQIFVNLHLTVIFSYIYLTNSFYPATTPAKQLILHFSNI